MDQELLADLMAKNFPWAHPEDHTWSNVHDGVDPKTRLISEMLRESVGAGEVLVHVLRGEDVYAEVAAADAAEFIGRHVLAGRIHASNRNFTGFLVVAETGVATAWKASAP
ncbi:MAG: hypothetical protein ACXWC2_21015 [Ramlibacter sp.]